MFYPSEEVENPKIIMHDVLIEDGVDGLVDMVVEREYIPTIISSLRLSQFNIQAI